MEIQKYEEKPVKANLNEVAKLARSFAASKYFDDLKGSAEQQIAQAETKIITGLEFGVPPSAAIRGIHIIKGKPTISAGLMSGLIKRSARYDYKVIVRDDKKCEIECFEVTAGKRESCGPNIVWTIQKANTAGLTKNPTWKAYPDRMLFARAISEACTVYFPDLLLGNVYTPEEMESVEDIEYTDVEVIEEGPPYNQGEIKKYHAIGTALYGKEAWDAKRAELAGAVSQGRTSSTAELTRDEFLKLLSNLEHKQKQGQQESAEPSKGELSERLYGNPEEVTA